MSAPHTRPTREIYRDRVYAHLATAIREPAPAQFAPYPGAGITLFVIQASMAVAYCDDDELFELADAVTKVARKAAVRDVATEESQAEAVNRAAVAEENQAEAALRNAEIVALNRLFHLPAPDEGGAR